MSQAEMADIAGVGRQAQVSYEGGERSPNADYLQAISAAGADVNYLLTGIRCNLSNDDEPLTNSVDFNKKKMNTLFDEITPKQQTEVIKVIEEKKRLNQCEIELEKLKKSTG